MKLGMLFWMTGLIFCLASCTSEPPKRHNSNSRVLKLAVMSDGRITVDGEPQTIESVRESLKQLAEERGVVWYYREAAAAEPPPEAMQVMEAIIENRLPVRLSSRPDYSDEIGPEGVTQ